MDQLMTTPEIRLAQLACVEQMEEDIEALEAAGVEVSDTIKAEVASARAHVQQALLDGDGQDRN